MCITPQPKRPEHRLGVILLAVAVALLAVLVAFPFDPSRQSRPTVLLCAMDPQLGDCFLTLNPGPEIDLVLFSVPALGLRERLRCADGIADGRVRFQGVDGNRSASLAIRTDVWHELVGMLSMSEGTFSCTWRSGPERAERILRFERLCVAKPVHASRSIPVGPRGFFVSHSSRFPHLPGSNALHIAANRFIEKREQERQAERLAWAWRQYWEENLTRENLLAPRKANRWCQDVFWQLEVLSPELVCFSGEIWHPTGRFLALAHRSHNFVLKEGALHRLTLAELFDPKIEWMDPLQTVVIKHLRARGVLFPPDDQSPDETVGAARAFTPCPAGLLLYFDSFEIWPRPERAVVLLISWAELDPLLLPGGWGDKLARQSRVRASSR